MQQKQKTNVAINQTADINNPPIGYHTLLYLEALRMTHDDTINAIRKTEELTRFSDYEISRRLANLQEYVKKVRKEFEYYSSLVEEWVSQFPDRDFEIGELILAYYCDIHNHESLRYLIAENNGIDTDIDNNDEKIKKIPVQNYLSRMRVITLNHVKNQ